MKIPYNKVPVSDADLCDRHQIGDSSIVRGPYEIANRGREYGISFAEWLNTEYDVSKYAAQAWDALDEVEQREILSGFEVMHRRKADAIKEVLA